jgi:hypothetical protein
VHRDDASQRTRSESNRRRASTGWRFAIRRSTWEAPNTRRDRLEISRPGASGRAQRRSAPVLGQYKGYPLDDDEEPDWK